jgi:type 1 glutamine amidotransferase
MKVKSIFKTCEAFPAQWQGHIEDGRMFYCRYRHERLTIEISRGRTNDVFEAMHVCLLRKDAFYSPYMKNNELIPEMESVGFVFTDEMKLLLTE